MFGWIDWFIKLWWPYAPGKMEILGREQATIKETMAMAVRCSVRLSVHIMDHKLVRIAVNKFKICTSTSAESSVTANYRCLNSNFWTHAIFGLYENERVLHRQIDQSIAPSTWLVSTICKSRPHPLNKWTKHTLLFDLFSLIISQSLFRSSQIFNRMRYILWISHGNCDRSLNKCCECPLAPSIVGIPRPYGRVVSGQC